MMLPPNKDFIVLFASVALVLALTGCAFTPNNWAVTKEVVDTEALSQVKRVGLLDVPIPTKIWLGDPEGAPAGFFNPLFSLATSTHTKDNPVGGVFISERSQQELQTWLQLEGIEVVLLKAQRTSPTKMLDDYNQFKQADVDAILEVALINVGYIDKPFSGGDELSPEVMFTYRLISPKTDQVLIESNVFYSSFNYPPRGAGATLLGPASHIFDDIESVRSQPAEAVKRMEHAIRGATEAIALNVASANRQLRYSGYNPAASTTNTSDLSTPAYWRNLYAGNTATGKSKDGGTRHVYYSADGTMVGRSTSRYSTESQDTGTWDFTEGGIFCGRWKKWSSGSRECFKESHYGDGKFHSRAIHKSTEYIYVIREGDPEELAGKPASSTGNTELASLAVSPPSPPSEYDLSGVYTSKVVRKNNDDYYCFNQKKSFLIELKQEGNRIEGTFMSGISGEIEGMLNKNKVTFTWYTTRCNGGLDGEWTVGAEGSSLQGYGWADLDWEAQKNN